MRIATPLIVCFTVKATRKTSSNFKYVYAFSNCCRRKCHGSYSSEKKNVDMARQHKQVWRYFSKLSEWIKTYLEINGWEEVRPMGHFYSPWLTPTCLVLIWFLVKWIVIQVNRRQLSSAQWTKNLSFSKLKKWSEISNKMSSVLEEHLSSSAVFLFIFYRLGRERTHT